MGKKRECLYVQLLVKLVEGQHLNPGDSHLGNGLASLHGTVCWPFPGVGEEWGWDPLWDHITRSTGNSVIQSCFAVFRKVSWGN